MIPGPADRVADDQGPISTEHRAWPATTVSPQFRSPLPHHRCPHTQADRTTLSEESAENAATRLVIAINRAFRAENEHNGTQAGMLPSG